MDGLFQKPHDRLHNHADEHGDDDRSDADAPQHTVGAVRRPEHVTVPKEEQREDTGDRHDAHVEDDLAGGNLQPRALGQGDRHPLARHTQDVRLEVEEDAEGDDDRAHADEHDLQPDRLLLRQEEAVQRVRPVHEEAEQRRAQQLQKAVPLEAAQQDERLHEDEAGEHDDDPGAERELRKAQAEHVGDGVDRRDAPVGGAGKGDPARDEKHPDHIGDQPADIGVHLRAARPRELSLLHIFPSDCIIIRNFL